ncbi:MAG: acyltransferase [Actinobacteria bacterium]|nr:MAG: acyltransferase [Actinomycetota bacterium]
MGNDAGAGRPATNPLGYRPALDGVRGIAILAVVSLHAFGQPAEGALGVDLFFVLSGFLITSLLLERRQRGDTSLRRFYARRALRLLPALFAMLTASRPRGIPRRSRTSSVRSGRSRRKSSSTLSGRPCSCS